MYRIRARLSTMSNVQRDTGDETLGARLRGHRESRGLSLRGAAAQAGLSAAQLHMIEGAQRLPGLRVTLALARLYGVTVEALAGHLLEGHSSS
jgi:transcriptional regulator with XRE-family HTH domain